MSENNIFSPSHGTSFFNSRCGLFALILPYFAFILPLFFPSSHLLSPFFLFLSSSFSFTFSPFFSSPFHIFSPKLHRLIFPPRGYFLIYRPLAVALLAHNILLKLNYLVLVLYLIQRWYSGTGAVLHGSVVLVLLVKLVPVLYCSAMLVLSCCVVLLPLLYKCGSGAILLCSAIAL